MRKSEPSRRLAGGSLRGAVAVGSWLVGSGIGARKRALISERASIDSFLQRLEGGVETALFLGGRRGRRRASPAPSSGAAGAKDRFLGFFSLDLSDESSKPCFQLIGLRLASFPKHASPFSEAPELVLIKAEVGKPNPNRKPETER